MAGNKAIYDTAMKRAHDHAWANQWERAIKEYDRALAEFPDDLAACRNRAQCLFRLRQWPEALSAYSSLVEKEPADLFAINRLAEIYLALGQQDEATETYFMLADRYSAQHQYHEAIRALRDLARAVPNNREVHIRLLALVREVGDRAAEVAEHIALSRIALEAGDGLTAQREAEVASGLDPESPEVRRWSYTVRRRMAEMNATGSFAADADATGQMTTSIGTGLMPQADQEPEEALELIGKASEAQNAGDFRLAMELYDQAVRAGAKRASVFYSAGLLNQQMGRPEMAVPLLERAAKDQEFGISANYGLGLAYSSMRNHPQAVLAFEKALGMIAVNSLTRNEADELIELYTAASEANLADNNPGRASSILNNLVKILKEKKWGLPQMAELEKKAEELYSRSIMSKLDGISRGSGMLDATAPVSMASAGLPPLPVMPPPMSVEATTVMVEGQALDPADATNRLAAGSGATAAMSGEAMPTQAMQSGALTGTMPVTDIEGGEIKKYSSDIETTMMRQPGSSLRTITEYLRAADLNMPTGDEAGDSNPFNQHTSDATIAMSDASLPTSNPEAHTFTSLSTQALMGMEAQSIVVQRAIAEAEFAMHQGQFDSALDSAMSVIEWEPEYLPVHLIMGDVYMAQGKTEDAIDKFKIVMDVYTARGDASSAADVCMRLLELQPDNPALKNKLGVLLMEAGRVDDAADALLSVPDAFYRAGHYDRALEEAEALKAQLPASSKVALATGTYLMTLGRTREALAELSRALTLDPGNNHALSRVYVALATIGEETEWDALQSLVERAGRDLSTNRLFMEELHAAIKWGTVPSIFYGLSVLAERVGLTDIAADALDEGLLQMSLTETGKIGPGWVLLEVLMSQTRADLALNAKDWGVAAQHYNRALQIIKSAGVDEEGQPRIESPRPQYSFVRVADMPQLYYGLAEAQALQNNWEQATEALNALKTLMPNDVSVYTRLADIYFRQGNLAQALAELNELLVSYQKRNDHEKTLETLGHMARLAPNNVPVRKKLADMYIKLGMTDYGLQELNTLAELQLKAGHLKDAMSTYQRAGDMHYTLGRHEEALEIYGRVVRIAPRDIEARQQLINMYVQSGKLQEAIAGERALADLFVQDGYTEEAISALHQLLALSPEDVPAHHKLAQQLMALGRYGEAARLYGRLVRLEPENSRNAIMQTEMLRMAKEAQGDSQPEPQQPEAKKGSKQKQMAGASSKRG
ncbi:MAG TPA: tetratricopeptide repeat protein [Chloroflexia bacterium]|jgi:tetratricopeptide (TPR) repeat protein